MGRLGQRARMLAHLGRRRTCQCCGARRRRYAEFNGRLDALCMQCGALERHRAMAAFLADSVHLRGARVLHFAPEPSIRGLIGAGAVDRHVTSDLDPEIADVAADITSLPFEDGAFDLVICSHVLEHVPDDRAAMSELARVCEPGGLVVVMVPRPGHVKETIEDPAEQDPAERERRFGQHDHVRIYGPDIRRRLEAAGLQVDVRRIRPDGPVSELQEIFACTPARAPQSR